jgi:hypothetical protein
VTPSFSSYAGSSALVRLANPQHLAWLLLCLLFGVAIVWYLPILASTLLLVVALVAAHWMIRRRMQVWQALILLALTGFIILNYGFENYVIGRVAGVPLLIGEGLMFGGLILALSRCSSRLLREFLSEPAVQCLLLLGGFTALHLALEVPRYGVLALRDASMFIEAVFVLAGFLWLQELGSIRILNQWLLLLLIANTVYSYTFPYGEQLQEMAPTSGVFQPIALLGQYQHNSEYLVAGAIFSLWLAPSVVNCPRWLLMAWAGTQLAALVLLQTRSCYVSIVVIGLLLLLLRDFGRAQQLAKLVVVGLAGMVLFVALVSILGLNLRARVVDINAESLEEHALSIFAVGDHNNRMGQDEDRIDWLEQVWEGTTATPTTFLIGQGFGEPLLKNAENEGMAVREPHNSTVGVFGRLGLIGVSIWLLFLAIMLVRFARALREPSTLDAEKKSLILWLFMFYVVQLILSTVQPSLEFSHCALPFYFLLGLGLAITQPGVRSVGSEITNVA